MPRVLFFLALVIFQFQVWKYTGYTPVSAYEPIGLVSHVEQLTTHIFSDWYPDQHQYDDQGVRPSFALRKTEIANSIHRDIPEAQIGIRQALLHPIIQSRIYG